MAPADPPALVVLTFDNLGEAADIEGGAWPDDAPIGRHASVTEVLPRLLAELDWRRLPATFYVEAINVSLYPDAVAGIAGRGHEVGHHAWRHERWGALDEAEEARILQRGLDAYAELGIVPRSFRPPGGTLTPASTRLLLAAGLDVCSPAGERPEIRDGLVHLPFAWELVDAFWAMDILAPLREAHGAPAAAPGPWEFHARAVAAIDQAVTDGSLLTLVAHPFLLADAAGWSALTDVLRRLADARDRGDLTLARSAEAADHLRTRK